MAITVEMRTEISQLYVALFGRAPDGEGLGFWVGLRDGGMSLTQIADSMYATAPARDYYPLFLTNQEIIASFYVNVLGRPADAEGLAFWTAKLNAAGATPGSVITEMIDVVANYAGTHPDGLVSQALFNNKVEVAQYYGEANGNIEDAATALASITADHATVDAAIAEIDAGTIGTDGIDVTLTTGQDSVQGTPASDVVHGTFGTGVGDTYTAGDSIDLGLGSVDQLNLVATGATASAAIVVKNTESINIQDTVGGTFNALLVENAPAISFFNTLAAQTSMVTNASQSSVYGLQGKGNLTVNFASTSGTSDTAMVSLAGVGTSASVTSTVNVSDTDTVEKINIATTGANFVTLVGGAAAASLTVTGDGTNTFALSGAGALAAVATIDASASTGANTFALGSNFNTGTVLKGGTGADTVSASLTTATLTAPTLTGVETLSTTWTANAILDLAAATGLTSLSINDKAVATGTVTVQNAQASVATVTVSNVDAGAANSALLFGYGAATKGDLTLKIGSTSGTATAVNLGAVTISNSNSLNITTLGALAHDFDNIAVKGNQTSLGVTVAADGSLTTGDIDATGNLGAVTINTAAGSFFSGNIDQSAGKTIGDVTINATGTGSEAALRISGGTESIGNIAFNITGNDISGYVSATPSGGGIGDLTFTVTGDDNDFSFGFSAGYISGEAADIAQGNVGNVTITVTGEDNSVSGQVEVNHGDLGDITVSVTGDGNGFHFSGDATQSYYYHSQSADQDSGYYYVAGGNIGNVSLTVDGDSSAGIDLGASGGSVGDVTVMLDNGAEGYLNINAGTAGGWVRDVPLTNGNIGNTSVTVGDDSYFSGGFSANGGDIGNITASVTGDAGHFGLWAAATFASGGYGWENGQDWDDYFKGGNIGDVSLTVDGSDATFAFGVVASGGNVGTSTIAINGDGASGWYYVSSQTVGSGGTGGDTGAVNVTLADDTSLWFGFDVDGALGALTVTAGDDVSFEVSGGGGEGGSTTGSPASTGATSLTFGNNADVWFHVSGFSGSTGAITGTFGNGGSDTYLFDSIDGNVGAITLTVGSNADTEIYYDEIVGSTGAVTYTGGAGSTFYLSGGAGTSNGKVTLTGGDSASSAGIWVDSGTSHAGVDASAWLGALGVSLASVGPTGTTIRVGAGGSWVQGTEGADNIFLGAGSDTVVFDTTPTAADVIFTFTVGATKDVLELVNAATVLEDVITADAASNGTSGDIIRLVDITGGQDITTAAGLALALEAGGEYASVTQDVSAAFTIITASSTTAATFYVFSVFDADADQVFDAAEVVLIGQVNATAASAIGGLVLGNFA